MTKYDLTGRPLIDNIIKARSQRDSILAIFKYRNQPITRDEVQHIYRGYVGVPINPGCARKHITDLANDGEIVLMRKKEKGRSGRNVNRWKIEW